MFRELQRKERAAVYIVLAVSVSAKVIIAIKYLLC